MLGFPRHLFPISCWHVGVPPRPQPMNELSQIVSCSHVHKQATWMPRPHIKFSHGGGKSLAASALGTLTWLLIQHLHQNDQLIVQRHRRLLIQNLEQKNCQLSVQSHWRLIQYLQTVFHCQRHHHHKRLGAEGHPHSLCSAPGRLRETHGRRRVGCGAQEDQGAC